MKHSSLIELTSCEILQVTGGTLLQLSVFSALLTGELFRELKYDKALALVGGMLAVAGSHAIVHNVQNNDLRGAIPVFVNTYAKLVVTACMVKAAFDITDIKFPSNILSLLD